MGAACQSAMGLPSYYARFYLQQCLAHVLQTLATLPSEHEDADVCVDTCQSGSGECAGEGCEGKS